MVLTSPAGKEPTALQWAVTYAPASIVSISASAGPAATAAGKTLNCLATSGRYTCVASGLNAAIISNGTVAVVNLTIAAGVTSTAIGIGNLAASSAAGYAIPLTATGGTVTGAALPTVTSLGCLPATLNSLGNATCTVTLSKAAPAGGATVTLSGNNPTLTLPATVTVAAGATTASFVATAAAIASDQSAVVTATYNGSSATATISLVAPVLVSALACNPASLGPNASSVCTVTLSKAAPTGGAIVALTNTNPTLIVQGSVTVAAAAVSANFVAATAAVPAAQSAVITATYNGSSANANMGLTPAVVTGIQSGLIGYWNLDEGSGSIAHDTSGSGYDGTVNGAAWTAGRKGGALSFSGTTSVVTPNLAPGNTFSVSAWVNPAAANQAGYTRILETRYDIGLYLGTDLSGTKYKFIVNAGTGSTGNCGAQFGCAEGGAIAAGWHLVTATYDGAVGKLYVDGAVVATDTFTVPPNTSLPLYLASYYASAGYGWRGAVDEVRLYNRAVTSPDISALYGDGAGLVSYWSFDEGVGSIAHDTSGSGYNATVTGAAWTAGKVNGALSFNNRTTSAVTPNIAFGSAFSVSAWVNPAAASQVGYARILETRYDVGLYLGADLSGTRYKLIVNSGRGSTGNCGSAFGCAEGGSITGGWHLLTATYDGVVGKLYVDGAVVASDTFTAPSNTSLPLYVCSYYGGGGYGWNGSVDEVRLYSRPVTSADVSVLYGDGGGLLGYWNFDEGSGGIVQDTSGGGYIGTVSGAAWTAGRIGGALSFSGGTNVVTVPNVALASTFSVSAWVNPAVINQIPYARILETSYRTGLYLGTDPSGTKYKFIVNAGTGSTGACGALFGCAEGGTITAGWHLVTATYDGAAGRLYVDGVLVASDTFTAPLKTTLPLSVGNYSGTGGYGWKGAVDEVRLYQRALTGPEILAIY